MDAVVENKAEIGISASCDAFGVSRSTLYRRCLSKVPKVPTPAKRKSFRALNSSEKALVLSHLHSKRFVDKSPAETHATLLEEDIYLCSERTIYRILESEQEVKERRNQLRRPHYKKPELLATGPNQVWSWDITKLKGPARWTYFHLYVLMDIFSRYIVGWLLAHRESTSLAKRLIAESCEKQHADPNRLTIHADRGPSMTSKGVAQLLADLGVTKSHNRPYVSNDNPFSEAQFKTMKYRPEFPSRFDSFEQSKSHCREYFSWYNAEHRHSGIFMLTPELVHYGQAEQTLGKRHQTLMGAYRKHPERFVGGPPSLQTLPPAVWINKPESPKKDKTQFEHQSPTNSDSHIKTDANPQGIEQEILLH
jgi:putative transposase